MNVVVNRDEKKHTRAGLYLIALAAATAVGVAVAAAVFREEVAGFSQYGYLGAFLISVASAATVIVYIPGVPVVFALGGMLPNPLFVGLAAGLGEAIGEFTGYLAVRGGHAFLRERHATTYARIEKWMKARGGLTLFLSSMVFNPIFDLIGAAAGALRFPAWKFFLLCWTGKTIKCTAVALLGWWGLGSVLRWLDLAL